LDESINIDPETNNDAYKLPVQVWRSKVQPENVSRPLSFVYTYIPPLDRAYDYYVYFHFAEIEKLSDGKKRIINITLNYQPVLSQPLVLDYLKPVTLNFKSQSNVWFNISAAPHSDAPPILNAFEIYKFITQVDSPTYARDGTLLKLTLIFLYLIFCLCMRLEWIPYNNIFNI
jgi:hypothetical protein